MSGVGNGFLPEKIAKSSEDEANHDCYDDEGFFVVLLFFVLRHDLAPYVIFIRN